MAIFSTITSRRYANRQAKATQQLIVFQLYSQGFALPIRAVQKVITRGEIYGASEGGAAGLTLYQDQELLVIDVEHRIFKGKPRQNISVSTKSQDILDHVATAPEEDKDESGQRYLLIVQNRAGKIVGLPIDSAPSLQRIPESAFTPLTPEYMAEGNIRCVSALIIQNKDEPPLFLLNPDQLIQSQQVLPSGV